MDILKFRIPILTIGAMASGVDGAEVRAPVVAGQFYPENADVLKLAVGKFLQDALPSRGINPFAIVVPHAGYIYSGQICADGWNQTRNENYDTIVLLGTNHTTPNLQKIALDRK